jgi:GntR family transcriptional regulator, transcriptional repressor for pyruvate dehydrogenase complex
MASEGDRLGASLGDSGDARSRRRALASGDPTVHVRPLCSDGGSEHSERVADMQRMGLVSHVELDLERMLSLGRMPQGEFPSEHRLAQHYGVSRATAREALLRLAARGLVVQHPGRRSRAVPLGEAITLENLNLALHAQGPAYPERRRLLEGYLALKRETAVELLVACCELASEEKLHQLMDECLCLREAARWQEDGGRWAHAEFDLLRMAARVVDRPGHALLIQSLERSFWGMAQRLVPHMEAEAICQWALAARDALYARDVHRLRGEVAAQLKAVDERLLHRVAPAGEPAAARPASGVPAEAVPVQTLEPEPPGKEQPEAVASPLPERPVGSSQPAAVDGASAESPPRDMASPEEPTAWSAAPLSCGEQRPADFLDSPVAQALASASVNTGGDEVEGCVQPGASPGPGAPLPNLSCCQTGSADAPPARPPPPKSPCPEGGPYP